MVVGGKLLFNVLIKNKQKTKKAGQSSFPLNKWLRTQSLRISNLKYQWSESVSIFRGRQLSIKMWLDYELKQRPWEWKIAKDGLWYQAQHFVTRCSKWESLRVRVNGGKCVWTCKRSHPKPRMEGWLHFQNYSVLRHNILCCLWVYISLFRGHTYCCNLN